MAMAQTALNGVHAAPDPLDSETERVWATLPKSMVAAIDRHWHAKQLKTRSAAIQDLIEAGLRTQPFRRPV
jgi:metal-responsive CopG/Arc/MetJ family transcriptional regulator